MLKPFKTKEKEGDFSPSLLTLPIGQKPYFEQSLQKKRSFFRAYFAIFFAEHSQGLLHYIDN